MRELEGLRKAVEAIVADGVTVETLPGLLRAAKAWADGGYAGTGTTDAAQPDSSLPDGFCWESDEDYVELFDSQGVLWASVKGDCAAVWHGGHSAVYARHQGPLPTLDAAKAWCVATLFGSRP